MSFQMELNMTDNVIIMECTHPNVPCKKQSVMILRPMGIC